MVQLDGRFSDTDMCPASSFIGQIMFVMVSERAFCYVRKKFQETSQND